MTEIISAAGELQALAAVMRPDWDQRALSAALMSASAAGWPWPRAFLAAARLLADPDATPRDLLAETRDPLRRDPPSAPGANAEYAAARAALTGGTP